MLKSTPGTLSAAQFIDSLYRRGRLLTQNELAAIVERETYVRELVQASQVEAARRARAAGQALAQGRLPGGRRLAPSSPN